MYGADIRSRSAGWTTLMYGASFSWLCALWVVGRWRSSGSSACDFLAEELRKLCHPHWRCPLPSTEKKKTYRTWKTINEFPNAPQSQSLYTVLYRSLNNPPVGSLSVTWYVLGIADWSSLACLLACTYCKEADHVMWFSVQEKMTKIIQNIWIAQNLKPDLALCTQWTHTGEWRYISTYSFWH